MSWANNPNGYHKENPTVYWTVFEAQQAARKANCNSEGQEQPSTRVDCLPVIEITYEEKMPYVAEMSAASLNFGSTLVGSPCGKSIALNNLGARSFSYTISGLDAPFSNRCVQGR